MPSRWIRQSSLALLLAGAPALADGSPPDGDLGIVPLTEAEAARAAIATAAPEGFAAAEPFEDLPAGAATAAGASGRDAFSHMPPNLPAGREIDFLLGKALFDKLWVSAPSSTAASDGLGPLYNARSCAACHAGAAKGHPPDEPGPAGAPLILRLAVPAPAGGPMTEVERYLAAIDGGFPEAAPHPVYGGQLQDRGTAGQTAEGRIALAWEESAVTLADGTVVPLRRPVVDIAAPGYGPVGADTMMSLRTAPQLIGLGLIEAIPAAAILSREDPADRDGDGISGRANIVFSGVTLGPALGRFGWKASEATVMDQTSGAFAADIGISSPLRPLPAGDCTAAQTACREAPQGADGVTSDEIDAEGLRLTAFYAATLAVPGRRGAGETDVLRGKELFHAAGCADCHTPKHVTHRIAGEPERSFQLIWPYTDLLLHDMGPGLADSLPKGRATGAEWRTAPLWGIALNRAVSGRESYLHDGRARTLLEAILWHGGEGQAARDAVTGMTKADRDALIRFLESL